LLSPWAFGTGEKREHDRKQRSSRQTNTKWEGRKGFFFFYWRNGTGEERCLERPSDHHGPTTRCEEKEENKRQIMEETNENPNPKRTQRGRGETRGKQRVVILDESAKVNNVRTKRGRSLNKTQNSQSSIGRMAPKGKTNKRATCVFSTTKGRGKRAKTHPQPNARGKRGRPRRSRRPAPEKSCRDPVPASKFANREERLIKAHHAAEKRNEADDVRKTWLGGARKKQQEDF